MTGILMSTPGTLFASGIRVTEINKTTSKTSSTTLASASFTRTAGNIYIVMLAWDPSGNSVPTVTVAPTGGGTSYTALASLYPAPATTSAGTGVLLQSFIFSQGTTATTGITATFSAAITAKAMTIIELIGATTTQRNAATSSRGTTAAPSYVSPTGNAKDIILTTLAQETNSANQPTSAPPGTNGGLWSTVSNNYTTGGGTATNVGISYTYKILTINSSHLNNWTMASTANWGSQSFAIQAA
jgi:hypothetical protein